MKKSTKIILAAVVIVLIYGFISYNGLVTLNEGADAQWAQVETQYQRRFDLIPNLVNSVQGIFAQEQKIFGDLADARSRYANAGTPNEKASAASQVETSLGRLLVVVENYPQLKANENFKLLQEELAGTESKIAYARQFYNDNVMPLNQAIQSFPTNFFAKLFGFKEREFFQTTQEEKKAVKVEF